jgi:hypothetical protein
LSTHFLRFSGALVLLEAELRARRGVLGVVLDDQVVGLLGARPDLLALGGAGEGRQRTDARTNQILVLLGDGVLRHGGPQRKQQVEQAEEWSEVLGAHSWRSGAEAGGESTD